METKPKTFGEWLRERRQAAGLSLQDVADRADLTKQTLSTLERDMPRTAQGRAPRPHEETVDAIAQAVGAPIAEARHYAKLRGPDARAEPSETQKLVMYFDELPRTDREAALTMIKALWQKQHSQLRAERQTQKERKRKSG